MKDIVKKILNGIAAGIVISIGCAVYLACENKYVGAVMFSVALLTIFRRGSSLALLRQKSPVRLRVQLAPADAGAFSFQFYLENIQQLPHKDSLVA